MMKGELEGLDQAIRARNAWLRAFRGSGVPVSLPGWRWSGGGNLYWSVRCQARCCDCLVTIPLIDPRDWTHPGLAAEERTALLSNRCCEHLRPLLEAPSETVRTLYGLELMADAQENRR